MLIPTYKPPTHLRVALPRSELALDQLIWPQNRHLFNLKGNLTLDIRCLALS